MNIPEMGSGPFFLLLFLFFFSELGIEHARQELYYLNYDPSSFVLYFVFEIGSC
jgi:hypothetical protein